MIIDAAKSILHFVKRKVPEVGGGFYLVKEESAQLSSYLPGLSRSEEGRESCDGQMTFHKSAFYSLKSPLISPSTSYNFVSKT
jgi:hypothetical protein